MGRALRWVGAWAWALAVVGCTSTLTPAYGPGEEGGNSENNASDNNASGNNGDDNSAPNNDDNGGGDDNSVGPGNNGDNNGGNNNGGNNNGPAPAFTAAPATLHRLTQGQARQSVRDLFGVEIPGALEADTPLHGFATIGATELTLSPLAVEQFEQAAWDVARAKLGTPQARLATVGCDLRVDRERCLRGWLVRVGRQVWRRPLTTDELDQLVGVAVRVGDDLRDPWQGATAALSLLLQSPHFLFRVEVGEPDPNAATEGARRYTSYEMASRLSFALWGTTPDAALLDAAERGELLDDAGLEAQARRLLDDPRAQRHMVGFFSEYMSLERLPTATKDAQLFPEATDALKGSMRRELEALFEEIAFVQERDLRELLTTDAALVDDGLAAVYGLPQRGGEWWDVLPAEQGRGGLLGRAGLMTVYSHATLNSPTLRGKFIRTRLLCQDVPPPPPGVRTELEEPAEGEGPQTLRQRLDAHRADPNCAGCHALMDPLGYPLEHFDPIGRRRETDHGLPIDATGEVDGVEVDGAADLGRALAAHPLLGDCWTRQLYRFATGHLELPGERPVIQSLAQGWDEDQYRLKALLLRLVMSDGFRKATAPQNEACDPQQGRERACESACGVGVERCTQGLWSACSAPAPGVEACDGRDNDCDGEVDEGLVRACGEASCGGAGVQTCGDGGQWGACSQPSPPAEICDGADNDCDGQVDEEVEVERRAVSFEALAARHDVCDGAREQRGPNCNAAIHRFCAGTGCASTGFGPVGVSGGEASLVCLSPSKAQPQGTTYSHLVTIHDGCDGQNQRLGPHCNAAIHRFCAGLGLTSGFGPLENSGDDLAVACTPGAEVVVGSYSELGAHNGACQAGAERVGPSCDNAIHLACVGRGFVSGFGPVENSGDTAVFTCVR